MFEQSKGRSLREARPTSGQSERDTKCYRTRSKRKMPREWKYLCRLGFSVDFVHRLGAGIDSMGKLLLHVLVGLGYFPNAKERITDCISISSK